MKKSIVKVMVIIGVVFAVLFIGLFLLVMCSSDDAGEEYSTGKIESEYQNDTGSQTAEEKENLIISGKPYGDQDTTICL